MADTVIYCLYESRVESPDQQITVLYTAIFQGATIGDFLILKIKSHG